MQIKLSSRIYQRSIDRGLVNSKLEVSQKSGLSYVTISRMVKGEFARKAFECLAKYFAALGFAPDEIEDMKMADIFQITHK